MVVFDEILGELLMQNNCVVIPSLGGFVANTVAAQVDVDKGIITPPKKALSFNKSLTNNDGLLISTLAEKQNLAYNEANNSVSTDVTKIKARLNAGERVHFQNVGFLYLNNAGKIAFEQDRFFNLLLDSYGMGSIQFVPVEEESKTEHIQRQEAVNTQMNVVRGGEVKKTEAKQVLTEETEKSKESVLVADSQQKKTSTLRKVARYAAAAAILPIAFYSFWIPMKTDVLQSGVIYSEDFNPFSKHKEAQYVEGIEKEDLTIDQVNTQNELTQITSHLTSNSGEVFSFPLTEDDYVSVRYNKRSINEQADVSSLSSGYHLIVGCFSKKKNAQSMLDKLNALGWQGVIVDKHEGLHRVSAAASESKSDILKKRSLIEQEGLSSWVLKK